MKLRLLKLTRFLPIDYFRDSFGELHKVSWPTRKDVINHTLIILISVAISMGVVAIIDYLLSLLVNHYLIK